MAYEWLAMGMGAWGVRSFVLKPTVQASILPQLSLVSTTRPYILDLGKIIDDWLHSHSTVGFFCNSIDDDNNQNIENDWSPSIFFNTAAYVRTNQLAPGSGMEGKSNITKKKKVNIYGKNISPISQCLAKYSWSNSVSELLRELKFASLTCAYVPVSECTPVFTYNQWTSLIQQQQNISSRIAWRSLPDGGRKYF